MARTRSIFVCQECGAVAPRWQGKCPACQEWNTLVEEAQPDQPVRFHPAGHNRTEPVAITECGRAPQPRFSTGLHECDRVLGGGLVPGSLSLVAGDPGIGKSTLMLQIARALSRDAGEVLYISGEESFDQTRLRATRLDALNDALLLFTETDVELIARRIRDGEYACAIVDSIQSVFAAPLASAPGTVGQVRECANTLLRAAKETNTPILLVGHVTKDGSIAGPRVLEHLVDTVLYFEGEGKQALRILRGVKNRFGSTNEIGVFEMTEQGLLEVANPSALFLNERPDGASGSVVIPSVEGTRPLLVEVQALVTDSPPGSPRRTVTGLNPNRISLILAVLEKKLGMVFSDKDVFVNVAGGVRLEEPATDLAAALALASSLRDAPVPQTLTAFGELGLAGEIRAVGLARQRITEASKFGFQTCILPKGCAGEAGDAPLRIVSAAQIGDAIEYGLSR